MAEEKVYRIGEVAAKLELNTSVLRFWESEFSELVPRRSAKGHRCYNDADVLLLKRIKQLLHEQGMTIEGAKRVLSGAEGSAQSPAEDVLLKGIVKDLIDVKNLLVDGVAS